MNKSKGDLKKVADEQINELSYEESLKLLKENRREALLRKTAAVFAQKGFSHISMDKLAKEVGVTKVVLYRYFKSKGELIGIILDSIVDSILVSDFKDSAWGRKRVSENLEIIRKNHDAFICLMRHARYDPKYSSYYNKLIDQVVSNTILRLNDFTKNNIAIINIQFVAARISSLIFVSIIEWIESGDPSNDDILVDWLVRSCLGLAQSWVDVSS